MRTHIEDTLASKRLPIATPGSKERITGKLRENVARTCRLSNRRMTMFNGNSATMYAGLITRFENNRIAIGTDTEENP